MRRHETQVVVVLEQLNHIEAAVRAMVVSRSAARGEGYGRNHGPAGVPTLRPANPWVLYGEDLGQHSNADPFVFLRRASKAIDRRRAL